MRPAAVAFICGVLLWPLPHGGAHAADRPALAPTGKIRQPRQFDFDRLRAMPSQEVRTSFQSSSGVQQACYMGVPLWSLLDAAGGLDDAERAAALHHLIKVTASDGYFVVISTGEIAPDFGGKPAMIAYQRDSEPAGAAGFRPVMPGDKHGGRYVRDVVTVNVE